MTISTAILLYSLSIVAGSALVVYGLSMKPVKREQQMGYDGLDDSVDSFILSDANGTLQVNDDPVKQLEPPKKD